MRTLDFEKVVNIHSLFPNNPLYNSNALCGEIGEAANVVKKIIIVKSLKKEDIFSALSTNDYKNMVKEELSDSLFYLTRLALDYNTSLSELMLIQSNKLLNQSIKYKRNFLK